MDLGGVLRSDVATIFRSVWTERGGTVVPDTEDLKLGNDAVKLDATVLYADMSDSTGLVNTKKAWFAAEIYKAYLHCAAKIIRSEGGEITAYDGDRVMAVFLGNMKNTTAARAALKINYARAEIVNPAIRAQYSSETYAVNHKIGIDTSGLLVARTGIRGSNDLVWVGRAANYAAKLCVSNVPFSTLITSDVYTRLEDSSKYGGANRQHMWNQTDWSEMNSIVIYGSSWWWRC